MVAELCRQSFYGTAHRQLSVNIRSGKYDLVAASRIYELTRHCVYALQDDYQRLNAARDVAFYRCSVQRQYVLISVERYLVVTQHFGSVNIRHRVTTNSQVVSCLRCCNRNGPGTLCHTAIECQVVEVCRSLMTSKPVIGFRKCYNQFTCFIEAGGEGHIVVVVVIVLRQEDAFGSTSDCVFSHQIDGQLVQSVRDEVRLEIVDSDIVERQRIRFSIERYLTVFQNIVFVFRIYACTIDRQCIIHNIREYV